MARTHRIVDNSQTWQITFHIQNCERNRFEFALESFCNKLSGSIHMIHIQYIQSLKSLLPISRNQVLLITKYVRQRNRMSNFQVHKINWIPVECKTMEYFCHATLYTLNLNYMHASWRWISHDEIIAFHRRWRHRQFSILQAHNRCLHS